MPSVTRSCRKRPTTSSCRPSDACSMAPTPARSRRGRPVPARRRPIASSSSPITGRRPRNRPWRCTPRSVPATRPRRCMPMPRRPREYERATELWDVVPARDRPTDRDLADIFDSAASAAIVIGDAARAVSLARKALELVDAAPDAAAHPERRARAREQLGFASWLAGDTATSIQRLEEAVDLLDGTPPSTEQARVLAGLAANLMLAGQAARSIPFAERAIETARAVGEAGIESRAMNTLGVDRVFLGSIAAGIELLRAALSIAKPIDDPTELPRAYANLGSILEMGGFVEEALEVCLEGAERTLTLRQRPQLPDASCGSNAAADADRAGAIPGGDGPARGPAAQRPAGPQHDPAARYVGAPGRADRRPCRGPTAPRDLARRGERHRRRAVRHRPVHVGDRDRDVGRRSGRRRGDGSRRVRPARRRRRRDHPRPAGDPRGTRGRRPRGPGPGGPRRAGGQGRGGRGADA